MPILAKNKNQLTYIFNSESHLGQQILAYLKATDKKVEAKDISKEKLGDTLWIEIKTLLGLPFYEIFTYINKNKKDLSDNEWLKLINNKPKLLYKPIVVTKDKAMVLSRRSEIFKFFGVDSAGLKKRKASEAPTTSSTTKDETFI